MTVRKANLKDIDSIVKLGSSTDEFRVSGEVVTFWPEEVLKDCVGSSQTLMLVAEENALIIGFIICNYNPGLKKAIIENIFVDREYRRKGVGKVLLKELVASLIKAGCKYACSLVEKSDKQAINFYLGQGFNRGIDCVWLDIILEDSFRRRDS